MRSPSRCGSCRAEIQNPLARFCSKCDGALAARSHCAVTSIRLLALPFILVARALAYPIKLRRERIRWLTEASDTVMQRFQGVARWDLNDCI
jgi:hypothetical protein